MSYSCHDHPKRQGCPQQFVQDGWNEDGTRRMKVHQPQWADIQCGHITSNLDPKCQGCRWRKDDD